MMPVRFISAAALTVLSLTACAQDADRGADKRARAAQTSTPKEHRMTHTDAKGNAQIVLGGGCFWCLEAVYERVEGVTSVESGYAGGHVPQPSYREVCTGTTGHAEVARLTYDSTRITLEEILDIFWQAHDPTTKDRQGADVGSQYRSIILTADDAQRAVAERSLARAQQSLRDPIVTEIVPLKEFHPAEDYHQDYYRLNPNQPYCRVVISPKLRKLGLE